MITAEMLGLTPAAEPLHHALAAARLQYDGYRGIGHNAFAYLDVFQNDDLSTRVFIVTESPINTGTSITNRAEVVAATLEKRLDLGRVFGGDEKGRPVNPNRVYIEHYPRSKRRGDFDESFSIVTFTLAGNEYQNAQWTYFDRAQVERLIGQEFAPERDFDYSDE